MIGIVYAKETKEVKIIIPDVVSYTDTDIIGADASARGIDLTQASFCIVESSTLSPGDILGEVVDARATLPPSLEEQVRQLQELMNSMMGV